MNDRNPSINEALRWALDSSTDAARASADWIATDIAPQHRTAAELFTDQSISLRQLRHAKSAYKTMRIVGETSADRRLGARLYAASIAAALAWHGRNISRQSESAMRRAFEGLLADKGVGEAMRTLAGRALCVLDQRGGGPSSRATESAMSETRLEIEADDVEDS
jgi:hypothetical protein